MANGADSEEFVLLSGSRTGLKREFAFALKIQSELSGSLGRTRSRKIPNSPYFNGDSEKSSNKRFKSSISKKEAIDFVKSGIREEANSESVKSLSDEEDKRTTQANSMEPKDDSVESPGTEEPKNSPTRSEVVKVPEIDIGDPPRKEEAGVKTLIMFDDSNKVQHAVLEKPLKQYVRSSVRSKVQLMDIWETTSSSSFVSEDVKSEAIANVGGSVALEDAKSEAIANVGGSVALDNAKSEVVANVGSPVALEDTKSEVIANVGGSVPLDNAKSEATAYVYGSVALEDANSESIANVGSSVPLDNAKSEVIANVGGSVALEDAKNEANANGDGNTNDVVSPLMTSSKRKLEMKMSKKIALTKFPTRIKELLETGMLEGLPIKYLCRGKKRIELQGMIKDLGIMCFCTSCNGCNVVTPIQFERHAGSLNKRPAEYIYLENGNNFRDVLNACKDAPEDMLEAAIQSAIASLPVKKFDFFQNCNGSFPASHTEKEILQCNSRSESKESQASPTNATDHRVRSSKPVLTPKSSDSTAKSITPRNKSSQGRITRKDLRLHKLVFEEDVLPDGTEVAYYARGQKLLEGYKKGFGIFCRCCNSVVSPSHFEAHAGRASTRKPYMHIYTSNGVSLHELAVSLSKGRKFSPNDNDDLCTICADGGDLLLCDGCPRAFHKDCVSLTSVPTGDWYCKYCQNMFQKDKFVEPNANAKAAGRVSGVDPIEQITKRCIRIVKTSDAEVGGCVLCRRHSFSKSRFGPHTVILCDQCEKEYHVGCLKDHKMEDLKELPKGEWFCCPDCNRIHSALQKLLIRGSEKLPDSLSNVIRKKHEEKGPNIDADLDVRWRVLSGKIATPETRLLLSKAVAIFHDRFDPIVDSTTGRDLIPPMVYGRNMRDQDFGGMYCALLTVNSTVVSAGILRIFGQEVAELPLVATSSDCQGQGYFQSLFSCIERLLGFLNVKNLVLPAADEAGSIWTDKFGFKKMTPEQLSQYRKDCQMMMTFQGTSMLQKPVPKCRIVGKTTENS